MIRKVLMTADTVGGVWTYAIDLSRELATRGVEVSLATMGRPISTEQWRQVRETPGLKAYESNYKLEWMDEPWADVEAAGRWLLSLADLMKPDLVHLNGYCHADLPWRAPKLVVCHSCALSWWRDVRGVDAPPEWDRYAGEVRRGLQAADMVVAPTRSMLAAIEELYGPVRNGKVIPNGRDRLAFSPREKDRFVFSAGRLWDEAKNVSALDAIAGDLSWPVMVAGEGSSGCSRRLGHLTTAEMQDWMGRASIYALPARYEPFGLSVLEAALSGCALVLGDIPSLRESWTGCALFVNPNEPQELRREIQRLISDPELTSRLGHVARERAGAFSLERFGNAYVETHLELAASRAVML